MDSATSSGSLVEDERKPEPPFEARGEVSERLLELLQQPVHDARQEIETLQRDVGAALARTAAIVWDDDLQLALFLLYGLHYGSVIEADDAWEWHPDLIHVRRSIEREFEAELRLTVPVPAAPPAEAEAVARALFELTKPDNSASLSKYVARNATLDQAREFLVQRSIYTLKEADPHSWAIPRLSGRAKAAMVEIQADEYGGGRADRMHSAIFAGTMRGLGLDDRYGAYLDYVPAVTLASFNMMTMFGLNRRLRGAISGHLAAFEMTSSIPNRFYGNGFRRLGFGSDVTWYFDEHVEADAVHEQIAARDLAGSLAEDEPALLDDIMLGASACLTVDGWAGQQMLDAWTAGRSSLRIPLPPSPNAPA
jgi:Iron-containing redox enzyme